MQLNIKPYLIIIASVILILVLYSIFRNLVFEKEITKWEGKNPSVHKGVLMGLFMVFGALLVPVCLKGFIILQVRAGNADLSLVKHLTQNAMQVVYGVWIVFALGLGISLPVMIRQGFFSNMQ